MFVIRWMNMVNCWVYYTGTGGWAFKEQAAMRFRTRKEAEYALAKMVKESKSVLFKLNSEVHKITETTASTSGPAEQPGNNSGSSCPPGAS